MKIAVVVTGSFCDLKLVNIVVRSILKNRKAHVTYSIPSKNGTPIKHKRLHYEHHTVQDSIDFSNPKIVNNELSPATIKTYTGVFHNMKTEMKMILTSLFIKNDYVLIHSPSLIYFSSLNDNIINMSKTGILWAHPSYPNTRVPWILSDEMKSLSLKKRYKSSIDMYRIFSLLGLTTGLLTKLIKKSHMFALWNEVVFKAPKTVSRIHQLNGLIDFSKPKTPPRGSILSKFIESNNKLVYFSFGSINLRNFSQEYVQKVMEIIELFIEKGYNMVYHSTVKPDTLDVDPIENMKSKNFLLLKGFVQHEWIIPKMSLVITSGSVCMTNIANHHGVPLLYIPGTNEQIFWAYLYSKNTRQPYIDLEGDSRTHTNIVKNMFKHLKSKKSRTRTFLEKLKKFNTNNVDSAKIIADVVLSD